MVNMWKQSLCSLEKPGKSKDSADALDITDKRLHHEIYLSDARRVASEWLKTVIRHPNKRR
jgi:hypothetical protein